MLTDHRSVDNQIRRARNRIAGRSTARESHDILSYVVGDRVAAIQPERFDRCTGMPPSWPHSRSSMVPLPVALSARGSAGRWCLPLSASSWVLSVLVCCVSMLGVVRRTIGIPNRPLLIGLPLTIALGFLVAVLVFPSLDTLEIALLAAILAPTDAALGKPVLTSAGVRDAVRTSLNLESGLNDGICMPIVVILLGLAVGTQIEGSTMAQMVGVIRMLPVLLCLAGTGMSISAKLFIGWFGPRGLASILDRGAEHHSSRRDRMDASALLAEGWAIPYSRSNAASEISSVCAPTEGAGGTTSGDRAEGQEKSAKRWARMPAEKPWHARLHNSPAANSGR
jgi:hypothetical protein